MLEFAGRYSNENLMVKQGKYFSIIFREATTTLGNCILICNRPCPSLGDLTDDEAREIPELCKWYETKIKKLYGAVKFNYIAMMMKEEFVHFHIIPRYDKDIKKYGIIWHDEDYPKGSKMGKIEVDKKVLDKVLRDLKKE